MRPFTLVLKGMIAMSRLRWPEGLAGRDIDAVARAALWRAGLDYDHGTGHGVGAYLGVHEGPASLSRRGLEPLLPGMILSIEPGYYREGAFGIRCENLGVVTPAGGARGRRPPDARLRDADARALRPPADRPGACSTPTSAPGSTPTTPASPRPSTPLVERETAIWLAHACDPL